MKFKEVATSNASTEAKVAALALLLDKELIKLADTVLNVKKLEGPKGEQGIQGPKGEQGDRGFDGTNGKDGADGKDGKDGEDGKQGVGVADAKIDFDGSLVITLTDGTEINAGDIVPLDTAEKIRVIGNGGGTSQSVLDAIDAINAIISTYGTMALQDDTAVDINGGAIDGTAIGAAVPATGVFTTLTAQTEVLKGTGQNLFAYSEQLDNAAWAKENLTVTADTTTSPTGTTTADSLVESVGAGNHGVYRSQQLAAGTYTLSGYFKANTRQYIVLAFSNSAGSGYASAVFDVNGGTVTKTGNAGNFTYLSSAITSVGSGWYRCSITASATEQLYYIEYYLSNVASPTLGGFGLVNYTGNGSSLYGWGLQLELASPAGTYVPTTTAAVYGTPTLSFSGVASIGLQSDGSLYETSAGIGNVRFYTNNIAQEQMRVSHTASAVNYVQVTGAATGGANGPTISAQGSDATVPLTIIGKGSAGSVVLGSPFGINFRSVGYAGATVVNYLQAQGSATTVAPVLSVQGSDTNISQVFQSKGTGAIDLAAGSKGVNISNGGTVTAITRTAGGTGYTSFPSVAITAPTTAGGVQATASITVMDLRGATIVSGGTGYTVNDVLTVVGGTGTAATLTVSSVSAGVITGISVTSFGSYTALPTNPVSVTGGTGSGATFTATYAWAAGSSLTITNAGSGYVEQPTVSFSGGGGSGAAAYATVGSIPTVKSIGGGLSFVTPSGEQVRILDFPGGPAVNYVNLRGGATGFAGIMSSGGSDTNIGLTLSSKGTGSLNFQTNNLAQNQFQVAHTASAVNYVQVTGAATGATGSTLSAQGSDANTGLNYQTKGDAYHRFYSSGGNIHFRIYSPSAVTAANYIQVTGSTTTNAPVLSAQGSDTNIPLVLQPKGTGALQAQQTDSTATGGNARGANAVDWQTARGSAGQVASGQYSIVLGGIGNTASSFCSMAGINNNTASGYYTIAFGTGNVASAGNSTVLNGQNNNASGGYSTIAGGQNNGSSSQFGAYNFIGSGWGNTGNASAAITTQATTAVTSGSTAVTLSAPNASIKVGQLVAGTGIVSAYNTTPPTYVAAISGTSLTLSQAANATGTPTLSFSTTSAIVVGGGNNQATGSYSFIGGGGDAGTAANRNVASGDWSTVGGGWKNVASGAGAFIGGGGLNSSGVPTAGNTASGTSSFVGSGAGNTATNAYSTVLGGFTNISNGVFSSILGGSSGTARGITGNTVFPASGNPISFVNGAHQGAILVLARQTTDATATVLASDSNTASTTNQVILPNNSAYYFRGEVISNVTGGGNTKGWYIEGAIKRGANAASTALVGTPTVTSNYADAGASTWTIAVTADTTNGGLAVTFTGQAGTTIRTVAQIRTTEVTF